MKILKISILFLILLPSLVIGQNTVDDIPPPPPPPPTPGYTTLPIQPKIYKNDVHKIEFQYPGHWKEIKINDADLVSFGGFDFKGDSFPDILSVRIRSYNNLISAEKKKNMIDSVLTMGSKGKLINSTVKNINGYEFIEHRILDFVNGNYAIYRSDIFFKENLFYQFVFLYNPSEEKWKEKVCDDIIAKVKIL